MSTTTKEERDEIAEAIDSARKVSPGEVSRLLADADRLARAEELLDMASQVLEDENVGAHVIRKIEPFLAGEK